ncbi:dTMP kinase [Nanoarchaeota archaeon]
MGKGRYYMLEGGEGCGKDYQADLLAPWLEKLGYKIILTKEPGGTKEAEEIRKILLDKNNKLSPTTELFLYEAARRELNEKIILPSINAGEIIISKRGFPSTYAYQGFGGGFNLNVIKEQNELAMQNIMPDKIFIIDVNPKKGLKKEIDPDRFAQKGLEYHQKVRQGYLDFAKTYPNISIIISYIDGDPEKMQEQIRGHIKQDLGIK